VLFHFRNQLPYNRITKSIKFSPGIEMDRPHTPSS
jgi:hypothetical protein